MSSSTVMKQGIREKCIDWAKSVVDSAISTPPLLSGEHISEHTYMSGPRPLWVRCERRFCRTFSIKSSIFHKIAAYQEFLCVVMQATWTKTTSTRK